jgi:hypothetical protein
MVSYSGVSTTNSERANFCETFKCLWFLRLRGNTRKTVAVVKQAPPEISESPRYFGDRDRGGACKLNRDSVRRHNCSQNASPTPNPKV